MIEAKPKEAVTGQVSKYYFDKSTEQAAAVVVGQHDEVKDDGCVTHVKVNATLGADRFKFTPPAGVQVMDMTKQ